MNFHALKEDGNQNPGMETENQVKKLVRFVLDNRLDFYNNHLQKKFKKITSFSCTSYARYQSFTTRKAKRSSLDLQI